MMEDKSNMKKPIVIFLLTFLLIAPPFAWVAFRWGGDLVTAFARDRFLLAASIFNIALYIILMFRILRSDFEMPSVWEDEAPIGARLLPRERIGGGQIDPNSSAWQVLFQPGKPPIIEEVAMDEPEPEPEAEPATPEEEKLADEIVRSTLNMEISDALVMRGYDVFGERDIGSWHADFIAIGESDTLIVGAIVATPGELVANETQPGENGVPSWYAGARRRESPVWHAARAAEAVRALISTTLPEDNGVEVMPVAVSLGAISNYADMENAWREAGVTVLQSVSELAAAVPDKTGTEVLGSYRTYVESALAYLSKRAIKKAA